jgi:SAM-dependent MidA family methyltransferase
LIYVIRPDGTTMLQALSLSNLTGIRHGFFDRSGGMSQGLYATLNGGVGSDDAPENVAENRARMARVSRAASNDVDAALARLIGHGRTGMGELFKVACFAHASVGVPPGFEH